MTKQNQTYPGMTDSAVEFFVKDNVVKVIHSGTITEFTDLSIAFIEMLRDNIKDDILVNSELKRWYPNSEIKRLEQFVKCRFGGLDFQADIKDGVLQDGEYWDCPMRGKCRSEGILCKLPIHNGKRLTQQDVTIIQLASSDMTNDVIAETMKIPLGTLHKEKKGLYRWLKIPTKQHLALLAKNMNLI